MATTNPPDPKPGDLVKISIQVFGIDLSRSYIIWYKDNKQFSAGTGQSSLSVQLGALGSATNISVYVQAGDKYVAKQSFSFEPTDIDLVWQADTFTPPFYQGKARAVKGSAIKIIATPYIVNQQKQVLKPEQLVFTWLKDGAVISSSSGLGKNVLSIKTSPADNQLKIKVLASDPTSKNSASKQLIINLSQPELGIFENKPLEGVNYGEQIGANFDLYGQEISFKAVPFFWPNDQLNNLGYAWQVNRLPAEEQSGDPAILTVRQPNSGTGVNSVSLQASNGLGDKNPLTRQFNIRFGFNLLKNNGN